MSIQYVGRNEIIVEVAALVQVGEEMVVEGGRLSKGAVARVTQIISQNQGITRMRMTIVRGRVLSSTQVARNNSENNSETSDKKSLPALDGIETASESFRRKRPVKQEEGGFAWYGDYDPRPRRGPANMPVNSPISSPNSPARSFFEGARSSGPRIDIVSDPNTYQLESVIKSIATPSEKKQLSGGIYLSPQDIAQSMGMSIETTSVCENSNVPLRTSRRSEYQEQWKWDESQKKYARSFGQAQVQPREYLPERALESVNQDDDFDPNRQMVYDPRRKVFYDRKNPNRTYRP